MIIKPVKMSINISKELKCCVTFNIIKIEDSSLPCQRKLFFWSKFLPVLPPVRISRRRSIRVQIRIMRRREKRPGVVSSLSYMETKMQISNEVCILTSNENKTVFRRHFLYELENTSCLLSIKDSCDVKTD